MSEVRVRTIYDSWSGGTPGEGRYGPAVYDTGMAGRHPGVLRGGLRINVFPGLTDTLKAAISKLNGDAIIQAGAAGAHEEALRILAIARANAPISTEESARQHGRIPGQLRASGRVEGPDLFAKFAMVNVVFGGPAGAGDNIFDVDYAYIMHEDIMGAAPYREGKPKFLEDAVREARSSGENWANMNKYIRAHLEEWAAWVKAQLESGQRLPYHPTTQFQRSNPEERNSQERAALREAANKKRSDSLKKYYAQKKAEDSATYRKAVRAGMAQPAGTQTRIKASKVTVEGEMGKDAHQVTSFKAAKPRWDTDSARKRREAGEKARREAEERRKRRGHERPD